MAHLSPTARAWLAAGAAGGLWALAPPGTALAALLGLLGAIALSWAPTGEARGDFGRGLLLGLIWAAGAYSWLPQSWGRFAGGGGVAVLLAIGLFHALAWALILALAGRSPLGLVAAAAPGSWLLGMLHPLPLDPSAFWVGLPVLLWPVALGGRPLAAAVLLGLGATWARRPLAALLGLLALLLIGSGWLRSAPTPTHAPSVGLVEPGFGAFDLRRSSTDDLRRHKLLQAIEQLPPSVDWIALPEAAWPHDPGPAHSHRRTRFHQQLAGLPPVVLGATLHEDGLSTNSLLFVQEGELRRRFDKIERVPLAERALLGQGRTRFRAGTRERLLPLPGHLVAPLICYEDVLPRVLAQVARGPAELLLAASHDGWLGPRGATWHLSATRMAAVSTGRWALRPTTSGPTAVIDSRGRLLQHTPWRDADAAPTLAWLGIARVPAQRPAWTGAGHGAPLCALLGMILLCIHRWRAPASAPPPS